jgi:thiol-disulfide isomerase/thioredoxin
MIRIHLTFIATLLLGLASYAQSEFDLQLEGQIFNAPSDEIKLIRNLGDNNDKEVATIELNKKGNFSETIKLTEKDYYLLQLSDGQKINLVVDGENTIKVYGNGENLFFESNIVGSDQSTEMNKFLRYNYTYKAKLDSANEYLRANQDKKGEIQQAFKSTYEAFKGERKRFMSRNAESPALIAVLPTFNIQQEFPLYEKTVQDLEKGFGESPTVQRIVSEYEKNKEKMKASLPLSEGSEAKDIILPNTQGDTLRLSDYKGKVVLLDFWASWCGPCRRENPNVVKLYKKYNEDGFEVFSVSLDKSKEKWIAAIEQDGLLWDAHVSDLKYWRSRAAQKYNVSSIPYTVLIDQEGKVIGTRLRGQALEDKLEEIYGH